MGKGSIPKDDATILRPTAGVFPSFAAQFQVYGATDSAIEQFPHVDPGIDNKTGAGFELIWLTTREMGMQSIQKS